MAHHSDEENDNSDNNSEGNLSDNESEPLALDDLELSRISAQQLQELDTATLKQVCKKLNINMHGNHETLINKILYARAQLAGEASKDKGKKRIRDDDEPDPLSLEELEGIRKLLEAKSKPASNGMQRGGGSDGEQSDDESDTDVFATQDNHILDFPAELRALIPGNAYNYIISKEETKKLNKGLPLPDKLVPHPPALQEEIKRRISKSAKALDRELRSYTFKVLDVLRPLLSLWKDAFNGIDETNGQQLFKQSVERVYAALTELTTLRRRLAVKSVNPNLEGAVKTRENALLAPEDFDKIKKSAKVNRILDFATGNQRTFRPRVNFNNGFRGRGRGRPFYNRGHYNNNGYRRGRGGYHGNNYPSYQNNNNNNKKD